MGKENIQQDAKVEEELDVPEELGALDERTDSGEDETPDLETLQEEIAEAKDRMLRIAADAENFKKRMERDKEKMLKYAGENIFRELLPTVDNLGRALEQGQAETGDAQQKLDALLEGVELVNKGLLSILEKFEVTPVDSVGQEFNPDEMDALTMAPSDEVPKNHVVQEFAKGYRFKDRVLRHAQVVVSSGKDS